MRNLISLGLALAFTLMSSSAAFGEATSINSKEAQKGVTNSGEARAPGSDLNLRTLSQSDRTAVSAFSEKNSLRITLVRDTPGVTTTPTITAPEPIAMFLLGTGLVGVAASVRRRRRRSLVD